MTQVAYTGRRLSYESNEVTLVEAIVPTVADDYVVVDAPPGLFELYREAGE